MPRGSFTTVDTRVSVGTDMRLIKGTPEQEAIWDVLLNTNKHVICEAVAGSGKTFLITQYAMRERKARIGLVAFNKHIATELTSRMGGQANVQCMTYHSLGYKAVRAGVKGSVQVDQYKVMGMLDRVKVDVEKEKQKTARYRISSMVSYAKTYGYGAGVTRAELESIVDRHDVDLGDAAVAEVVYAMVPRILQRCMDETATVDFDDMVWLPSVLGLSVPKFDVLCVDEYQDTGVTQQWLAVRGGERVCAVGDPRQAIYSFRGCDGTGFAKLRSELGGRGEQVVTLPLTLTRRCPKSHVRLAQQIVPQIVAMPDAPEGVVRVAASVEAAVKEMRAGDLVVCRVNAELVGVAYQLLKRGVKAVVRGRDIGKGIEKLLDKAWAQSGEDKNMAEVLRTAWVITGEEVQKMLLVPHGRGEARAEAARDKMECLNAIMQEARSVQEAKDVLVKLFAEFEDDGSPKHAVVLGTVHRTKGLEANRVFVLRPDLIPHPMARKEADVHAEHNLAYVAVTRAKFDAAKGEVGELVFVGGECGLFDGHQDATMAVGVAKGSNVLRKRVSGQPRKEKPVVVAPVEVANTGELDLSKWIEGDSGVQAGVPEHRKWGG